MSKFIFLFIPYARATALDHQNTDEFRSLIVEGLNRFAFPHKTKGVAETALTHLDYMVKLIETLPIKAKRLRRIAYLVQMKARLGL